MMEVDDVLHQKHTAEPWMNGAAIVLSDGREVPITDSMVRQSLDAIVGATEEPEQPARRSA